MDLPSLKNPKNLSPWYSYLLLVAFRMINGFFVQTYGHPDEYWQSVEVAHNQAFGYGYLTWEWAHSDPIRSPVFPGFFGIYYLILKKTGLDHSWLIAHGPRIIHAFISGLFDLVFVKLAMHMTKIKDAGFWLIINYTTWYSLYGVPRTVINTSEATLFLVAFYFWKLAFDRNNLKFEVIARLFISLNFCMRPTSIVIWAPIWLVQGFTNFNIKRFIGFCFKCGINCIYMVVLSIFIDTVYFRKVTWTAFNFVKFNVLEDKSAQYGIYHPTWYFTAAMPLILLTWFPFLVAGGVYYTRKCLKSKKVPEMTIYIVFESLFLSMNPHKEDRFLMKLLPFMFILTGIGLQRAFSFKRFRRLLTKCLLGVVAVNLLYFGYACLIDKRGSMDMMEYLRKHNTELESIYFFTECHRTPFYSQIHKNIPMKFPECSPYEKNEINDSKLMFINPPYFIKTRLEDMHPSHIVLYSQFLDDPDVLEVLDKHKYKEKKRYFNSLFVDTPVKYSLWHELVLMEKQKN